MATPVRMLRLLQGDVGSGKTLVAALAMLGAVEAGAQAAIMAPTETLARQHHRTLTAICPIPVALLTGTVKGIARRNTLLGLAAGRIQMVVGTHALFQDAVTFRDLGLAVIDEQHRFGVGQRLSLGGKGAANRHSRHDRNPHPAHPAADAVGGDGRLAPDAKNPPEGRKSAPRCTPSACSTA